MKESELTLSPIVFKQRASSSDLGYFHRSLAQLDMHHWAFACGILLGLYSAAADHHEVMGAGASLVVCSQQVALLNFFSISTF